MAHDYLTDSEILKGYLSKLKIEKELPSNRMELIDLLHLQHSFQIPFENMDIILGKTPSLEKGAIKEKVLINGRGGYCFELNGLFYSLLEELGMEARFLNARIIFGTNKIYFRGHMLIMFKHNDVTYIADVGYRYGLIKPIPLKCNIVFKQYCEQFRLMQLQPTQYCLQKIVNGQWADLYVFTTEIFLIEDFVPINYYNSHCIDSIFMQTTIVSVKNVLGSISMIGNKVVSITNGLKDESVITSSLDYHKNLQEKFNIQISLSQSEKIFSFNEQSIL